MDSSLGKWMIRCSEIKCFMFTFETLICVGGYLIMFVGLTGLIIMYLEGKFS